MNFEDSINIFFDKALIGGYPHHVGVKIPTKRDEDVGYDIYADLKTYFILVPGETYLFPTGLSVVIPWGFWLRLAERGSTAKYGLSLRAGVVDTGYRGEIFVALTNCSNRPIVFNALPEEANHLSAQNPDYVFYPAGKAIVQGILEKKTLSTTYELTTEQFNALPSTERGSGKIGSSGK